MPNIEQVPAVLYNPLDAYNYLVDNVPLTNILARIDFINDAVDIVSNQVRDVVGTAGSLSNRLVSINADGSLKASAIDTTQHNIGQHADGNGLDGNAYVRMLATERSKLDLVADGATNLALQFDTTTSDVYINSGTVEIEPSVGIVWNVLSGNRVIANLTFPTTSIHKHYYDQEPQFVGSSPDYIHYQVSSMIVSFITGSLRVAVNGYLLSQDVAVDVPLGLNLVETALLYTENSENGTFYLSSAITSTDIIRIDFDILLYTGDGNSDPVITTGAQGSQGFQGTQGFQGMPNGPQGSQGFQGETGVGLQGNQGSQGNQGVQGLRGFQGFIGVGVQGSQGFQGETGIGSQGVQGSQGFQGPSDGPQGNQGFQGVPGVQGSQGNQGVPGFGLQGMTGPQGNQGSQGITGGVSGNVTFSYGGNNSAFTVPISSFTIVGCNTTSHTITAVLPASGSMTGAAGAFFIVKDEAGHAATNNITVAPTGGDTIDHSAVYTINQNYAFAQFYSNGTGSWFSC